MKKKYGIFIVIPKATNKNEFDLVTLKEYFDTPQLAEEKLAKSKGYSRGAITLNEVVILPVYFVGEKIESKSAVSFEQGDPLLVGKPLVAKGVPPVVSRNEKGLVM